MEKDNCNSQEEMEKCIQREYNKLSLLTNDAEKKFVIVGGQSGAGKSKLVADKYKELNKNAVIINIDELRRTHPNYSEIYEQYGQDVYKILHEYTANLIDGIMQLSKENGKNIIFEVALQNETTLLELYKNVKRTWILY